MNLRELCPECTDERLEKAEQNLRDYFDLMLRIYTRISKDPVAYRELQRRLTEEIGSSYGQNKSVSV